MRGRRKMKVKAWVVASWSAYSKEFVFSVMGYEPSRASEVMVVEEQEIEVADFSAKNLTASWVQKLRELKSIQLAEHEMDEKRMEEKIQSFLALENLE
jgi:hypothetical protein